MSERSVNLTTLFLGRLRPPKRLTSTSCTYFRQLLTNALLEKAEGKTKYVARPGMEPRTPNLRVRCPTDCSTRPGYHVVTARLYFRHVRRLAIAITGTVRKMNCDELIDGMLSCSGEQQSYEVTSGDSLASPATPDAYTGGTAGQQHHEVTGQSQ